MKFLPAIVKKIKLKSSSNGGKPGEFDRGDKNDRKIFREVTALSRLNHQNIVRYYTTWVEEAVASPSNAPSDTESEDGQTVDGHRSSGLRERTRSGWIEDLSDNPTSFDLNDLDTTTTSGASFPSIHYTSGDVFSGSEDEGTDDEAEQIITNIRPSSRASDNKPQGPLKVRTLYIQMVNSQMISQVYIAHNCDRNT